MGIIEIEDMEFYAYHGCYAMEKQVGNLFVVQATLTVNMDIPAKTDSINDALNYQTAYQIIQEQMSITSSLLEHVAQRIIDALYAAFPNQLITAKIKVSKMTPPMGGKMKAVSVTLQK